MKSSTFFAFPLKDGINMTNEALGYGFWRQLNTREVSNHIV